MPQFIPQCHLGNSSTHNLWQEVRFRCQETEGLLGFVCLFVYFFGWTSLTGVSFWRKSLLTFDLWSPWDHRHSAAVAFPGLSPKKHSSEGLLWRVSILLSKKDGIAASQGDRPWALYLRKMTEPQPSHKSQLLKWLQTNPKDKQTSK